MRPVLQIERGAGREPARRWRSPAAASCCRSPPTGRAGSAWSTAGRCSRATATRRSTRSRRSTSSVAAAGPDGPYTLSGDFTIAEPAVRGHRAARPDRGGFLEHAAARGQRAGAAGEPTAAELPRARPGRTRAAPRLRGDLVARPASDAPRRAAALAGARPATCRPAGLARGAASGWPATSSSPTARPSSATCAWRSADTEATGSLHLGARPRRRRSISSSTCRGWPRPTAWPPDGDGLRAALAALADGSRADRPRRSATLD